MITFKPFSAGTVIRLMVGPLYFQKLIPINLYQISAVLLPIFRKKAVKQSGHVFCTPSS